MTWGQCKHRSFLSNSVLIEAGHRFNVKKSDSKCPKKGVQQRVVPKSKGVTECTLAHGTCSLVMMPHELDVYKSNLRTSPNSTLNLCHPGILFPAWWSIGISLPYAWQHRRLYGQQASERVSLEVLWNVSMCINLFDEYGLKGTAREIGPVAHHVCMPLSKWNEPAKINHTRKIYVSGSTPQISTGNSTCFEGKLCCWRKNSNFS